MTATVTYHYPRSTTKAEGGLCSTFQVPLPRLVSRNLVVMTCHMIHCPVARRVVRVVERAIRRVRHSLIHTCAPFKRNIPEPSPGDEGAQRDIIYITSNSESYDESSSLQRFRATTRYRSVDSDGTPGVDWTQATALDHLRVVPRPISRRVIRRKRAVVLFAVGVQIAFAPVVIHRHPHAIAVDVRWRLP